MNKKLFTFSVLSVLFTLLLFNACKKDEASLPLEPISLISPDTAIVRRFPGDSLPLEIQFTTDRPINWVKGMYDIDSTNVSGYVATYPDTLFFVRLDTLDPRVNLYTYKGAYFVPDTLDPYNTIRFKISFNAGSTTFIGQGQQNYPAGIVTSTKEFRIDVR